MGKKELTSAAEDYLKVIWTAQEWTDAPVTVSALSAHLGFSASSVSEAVKKLASQGFLTHARYGSVALTPTGEQAAVNMVRRHRLIETFLVEYLGYGWGTRSVIRTETPFPHPTAACPRWMPPG